jgi:putative membrane-bound dehydrogenase-like protein
MRPALIALLALLSPLPVRADDPPPGSTDPRIRIELFAEHPQLVTPTGLDVDHRGRVWAIESNTHFPPEEYAGHPTDRLLILRDTDGDGRADDVKLFADGFTHAMSAAVRPVWMRELRVENPESREPSEQQSPSLSTLDSHLSTQVFLATRREIVLLEDTDNDGVCDRRTTLVHLETKGNYPHNGLAGFAFDALGWMYFGFGENLGEPYKIIARDGAALEGGGEGGNLYRMRPDGTQLQFWATGFWNPHASCVDAFGRLFTVDNDADSRPPCRLLHIVEGGDYGYRFRNGRKGLHPFTAWNGEIPGTLPMVAGTGEAPSGIVAYESDLLPDEYRGDLLATSWGDHRIDRFRLKPKGASFESIAEPLITGGENFRPVGLALAPDGSLYCTDWVLREYKLHGKGRIWRISAESTTKRPTDELAKLVAGHADAPLRRAVKSPDLATRRFAARRLAETTPQFLVNQARNADESERTRYESISALALLGGGDHRRVLKSYVPDRAGPFDSIQTAMSVHFDERPSPTALLDLIEHPDGSDPAYVLAGLRGITPLLRAFGSSQPKAAVALLNRQVEAGDPFVYAATVRLLSETLDEAALQRTLESDAPLSPLLRVAVLLAARQRAPRATAVIAHALNDASPVVRRAAVQWAGEEPLSDLRPQVEAVLRSDPMTTDLFLATLAALELLDGKDPQDFDKTPPGKYVVPLLTDAQTPTAVKVQALRLVDPAADGLTPELLAPLLARGDAALRLEAVRTLPYARKGDPFPALIALASAADSESGPADAPSLPAEAVLSLAILAHQKQDARVPDALLKLLFTSEKPLQVEIARALRGAGAKSPGLRRQLIDFASGALTAPGRFPTDAELELGAALQLAIAGNPDDWPRVLGDWAERPATIERWRELPGVHDSTGLPADAAAGRRVFYNPNGAACSRCHTVEGRGGRIGPDLSTIGRATSRAKLIDSILEPSKEVAPQFTTWAMATRDGRVHTGMIVHENEGKTILGDAEGKTIDLQTIDIEQRTPQRTSVMPDKLQDRMTVQEFRDLLTYLESLGK